MLKNFLLFLTLKKGYLLLIYIFITHPNSRLHPRLGFIISNKIEKLSVRRNYMRRLLREILKQQLSAEAPFDIIVRVHKAFSRKNINQIDNEVRNLIKGLPS